jgi:hypothetical protein
MTWKKKAKEIMKNKSETEHASFKEAFPDQQFKLSSSALPPKKRWLKPLIYSCTGALLLGGIVVGAVFIRAAVARGGNINYNEYFTSPATYVFKESEGPLKDQADSSSYVEVKETEEGSSFKATAKGQSFYCSLVSSGLSTFKYTEAVFNESGIDAGYYSLTATEDSKTYTLLLSVADKAGITFFFSYPNETYSKFEFSIKK